MKFRMKAKTKVTKNQTSLLRKYFRYPFTQHLLTILTDKPLYHNYNMREIHVPELRDMDFFEVITVYFLTSVRL